MVGAQVASTDHTRQTACQAVSSSFRLARDEALGAGETPRWGCACAATCLSDVEVTWTELLGYLVFAAAGTKTAR